MTGKHLAVLPAVFLLAGCAAIPAGTPPGPGTAKPTGEPVASSACAIVTEADAATALGFDPGAGTETSGYDATSCVFGNYPQMVTVNLAPTAGKAGYDRLNVPPKVGTLVELSGIGDAAFGVLNAPVATVEFLQGDAVVAIVIVNDGSKDRAVALAQTAAERL
jgi:hypothetical protein